MINAQLELSDTAGQSEIINEINKLIAWGGGLGVAIQVEIDGQIFISDFGRNLDDPSTKGNGRLVLDALLAIGDRYVVSIETSYMTDEPKLGEYYRSFGFEMDGNPGIITNLKRIPRSKIC
jgi:hypothetical protein